jgi:hypothetical protein
MTPAFFTGTGTEITALGGVEAGIIVQQERHISMAIVSAIGQDRAIGTAGFSCHTMLDNSDCPEENDIATEGDTADNRNTASSIRLRYVLIENIV